MGEPERPEELINHYVKLLTTTGNITSGLGALALLWSTVVLLGGFVSVLQVKEFWVLTGLSFLMACRVVDNIAKDLTSGISYTQEEDVIRFIGRQKWASAGLAQSSKFCLRLVLLPKCILLFCVSGLAVNVTPYVSLGISVWRLVRRDYGDAGGDAANRAKLAAALDIFYALILFQSLFVIQWGVLQAMLFSSVTEIEKVTKQQCGGENWSPKVVEIYWFQTLKKFKEDEELPDKWNLITYAVGLLQSASGDDDHLWGARVLDKLFDKDAYVRQELLSSRVAIQNLIGMIGPRGTADNIENRERAARILAHLARDLHITHFPGTLQCICSLLESCNQFCETCPSPEKNSDEQSRSLEASQRQDVAHMAVPIEDQTDYEQEQVVSPTNFKQVWKAALDEWPGFTYKSRGAKELISQGLVILEGLTQDKVNCTKISRHQLLLYKITSPLSSHDFLSNVWDDDTMVEMLGKSLTVVSRLLTCPGDGATRLRQELASTTAAVSNMMAILQTDSGAAQELHGQALEILTELAFDYSFKKLDYKKLFKALLCIFVEEAPSNNTVVEEANNTIVQVEQADRENATRLRGKAGEALARLLLLRAARDANVADILSRQEAIHLLTKVLNQILSSKMGTTTDAVKNAVKRSITEMEALVTKVFNKKMGANVRAKAVTKTEKQVAEEVINQILYSEVETIADAARKAFTRNENLPTKVVDEILSSKMETNVVNILRPLIQEIEKQSEERKFLAAILSVAVVICNENVISKEEFARATPEDAALVKKLKEILKLNKHSKAECLSVVKLTCQVVIAMIRAKPSCIQYFNEHNFKETLTEASGTMSEVDKCMLFAGIGREVAKPARSLASLVKEVRELLNTA